MRALVLATLAVCATARADNVNQHFTRGTPTFVVGTAGDPASDRAIAAQVGLVRALFPAAAVVTDKEVLRGGWPANPVVYGGPHVNALVASLELPLRIERGRVTLGSEVFQGSDVQVIAVIPAGKRHPQFLLFAGAGTPGTGEINSVRSGPDVIQVNDAFGKLATGVWVDGAPQMQPRARRIPWRMVGRRVAFPAQLPPAADEAEVVAAVERGLAIAAKKLGVTRPPVITTYVYPDPRSKQTLTGNIGHGHAAVEAGALHVIAGPPAGLERLIAHEGTHAIAYRAWGATGTPLFGEGLAVWAAGGYQGVSLADWAGRLSSPPTIADLLTRFRATDEAVAYPVAGLFVEVAIATVGLRALREHMNAATPATWEAACRAAGTSPEALQRALDARLKR